MGFQFKQSKIVQSMQRDWKKINILYAGRDEIIANMDFFYAGLEGDTQEQKLARWIRAPKPIHFPSVINFFSSSIYHKNPQYTLPLDNKELQNIDLLGNSLNEYVPQITDDVLKKGSAATIIDYSDVLKKPYLLFVTPDQFVSFFVQYNKGYPELTQFIYAVMEESQDPENEFNLVLSKVHYVWDLFEEQVRVRKYIRTTTQSDESVYDRNKDKTDTSDELQETTMIVMNGKPLTKLPIIIHGRDANNFTIERSVLQDVVDLNIDLFNRVVDQIEVLHMTAMPTPFITGADPNDPDIPKTIGCSKLWVIGDADAKVGLLEFSGRAAQAHRDIVEDLKETMAVSGAQILKQQGVSRETATSVLIRTGQETAIITNIVQNISSQIEAILEFYCEWLGKPIEDISYKLNADFISVDMEPNAQIALVRSWLDGAISHPSMFEKMKQGELIPSDKSFNEELEDIKKYPPPFPAKEKDAEIAEDMAELNSELTITENKKNSNADQNNDSSPIPEMKGDAKETGNSQKNTEIKN